MKTPILVVLVAGIVVGCRTDQRPAPDQGQASYDTNLTRSKIVSTLPPGWSLLPHQDQTQHRFTSAFFTDPRNDAFILVGPMPNYIDWTDKQDMLHREYLAKECLYVWTMPGSFEPQFERGIKANGT